MHGIITFYDYDVGKTLKLNLSENYVIKTFIFGELHNMMMSI